jgi:hypothetical protein
MLFLALRRKKNEIMRITNERFSILRRKSSSLSNSKRAQVVDLNANNSTATNNNTTFTNVSGDFMGADVTTHHTSASSKQRGSVSNFYVGQPRRYNPKYEEPQQAPHVERVTSF